MKRLWIAVALLAVAAGLCGATTWYQHRQIDQTLDTLDRLEQAYNTGDRDRAEQLAEQLSADYKTIGRVLSCFVAHNDLAESQGTVSMLPTLLQQGGEKELRMELARLREQLLRLRNIDDPLLQNIL